MEVTESTQRHTRVRLEQIELVLFTLCNGNFVFCDVAAEISAQVMAPYVRLQGLYVGSAQLLELAYLWDPPWLRVLHMSRSTTKQIPVRPAKTQINQGIHHHNG